MKGNDDEKAGQEEFGIQNRYGKYKGDESFPCPRCGMVISPDDESDENYEIVDTKVVNDELAELVIICGKCRSTIKITCFSKET